MDVVIVESPSKAKTINKYLGKNYTVLASYGHVRDLPSKDGSVLPDEDFSMTWDVDAQSQKRLNDITRAVKGADKLVLATDPDREGEAISWHVLEVLKKKGVLKDLPVERVVFNAITKKSILDAMEKPRELDQELIDAYLARRALDYLVGFTLSPVLWRKLPGARSAGRVQSVALRLICQRELEIEKFLSQEYWTIAATASTGKEQTFPTRLVSVDGTKLTKFDIPNEALATELVGRIAASSFSVSSVDSKPTRRNPYAPFTTSTIQQEASRKLGFSASRTMQVAQRLYEGIEIDGETTGLITYMRTDGVQIAPEAIAQARNVITSEFGEPYLPSSARVYQTKAKNAQEAHEAIRPTDLSRLPSDVRGLLEKDQFRLYELVWKRTIASQMESARLERTTININSEDRKLGLRASGSVLTFDGFLKLYQEDKDEPDDGEEGGRLPKVAAGDRLGVRDLKPEQHFTEPPPRFTEASLVKRMEELGIGRPSTYASTLSVLRDRGYVNMDGKRFLPDDKGRLVTAFLESYFTQYVEYGFTADLEEKLDKVSAGELNWRDVLREFWTAFSATVDGTTELRITHVLDRLNEVLGPHVFPDEGDGKDPRKCPSCDEGELSLKVGRFGAFVGCSNYPKCKFTRQLNSKNGPEQVEDRLLGKYPETDQDIWLKSGRFGPYIQVGEQEEDSKKKPKRAGIPKGWVADEMDLPKALKLLSLPREVGLHPEDGKKITAGIGRFGPFVLHDKIYANMEHADEVFEVGINRAVDLIAEKKANPGRRQAAKSLKDLGDHPEDGKPIQVLDGRFGPYVKHGKINATLPADTPPDTLSVERALELLDAKAKKMGKKPAAKKKTTAKKKTAAKKKTTAKKKTAAKKKTTAKKKTAAKKKTTAKKKTAAKAKTAAATPSSESE
ncbi:MAG: DNA topoisomerase-1 [Parvibaculaceae bacterium]|jgi:DNA topoisomerase-1